MKPNKKQRHEIYKKALAKAKESSSPETFGLCYFVRVATLGINIHYSDVYHELQDYPEIYECKTSRYINSNAYFFERDDEGLLQRLAILDNAIKLTK